MFTYPYFIIHLGELQCLINLPRSRYPWDSFFHNCIAFGVGCCEIARIHADAEFNRWTMRHLTSCPTKVRGAFGAVVALSSQVLTFCPMKTWITYGTNMLMLESLPCAFTMKISFGKWDAHTLGINANSYLHRKSPTANDSVTNYVYAERLKRKHLHLNV